MFAVCYVKHLEVVIQWFDRLKFGKRANSSGGPFFVEENGSYATMCQCHAAHNTRLFP